MPPFFRGLDALTIDNGRRLARLSFRQFAAFHVKCMVDAVERAIIPPADKIPVDRAALRQFLRDRQPLTTGAQNLENAVDDFPDIHLTLVSATLGRRDQRFDQTPFVIWQVTGIPQLAAVVAATVVFSPHRNAPCE
jgi:hypothetical protein